MTTPGWASCCPDFPRVACFIGICTIAFQGINNLAADYIINNGFNYLGILFIDFYGDNLIQKAISLNQNLFGKCSAAQISSGCTCCNTKGVCLACNE
jgi:1-phosphatidylinositol phosphodiesterase